MVTDDNGKSGNALQVVVAEAPLVQKDMISPGPAYTGTVHYANPYLMKPHLKFITGKRHYDVVAETENGFTWVARLRPDDYRADATKDAIPLEKLLGNDAGLAALRGTLKPDLVFEGFTWEASGLRAPPSALPPKVFEQADEFYSQIGQGAVVHFPIPYASAPSVVLSGGNNHRDTVIVECTATGFKWKNIAKDRNGWSGDVRWKARGVLGSAGK